MEELNYKKVKSNIIDSTLQIARILQENGIDLKKIQIKKSVNGKVIYTLLKDINQKGINIEKVIKENNLDENFHFGIGLMCIRQACKGTGSYVITQYEEAEAKQLGLCKEDNRTFDDILKIAEILKQNGVNLRQLQLSKKINGEIKYLKLKELKQIGINIEEIIKKYNLDGELCFGLKFMHLKQSYYENMKYKITKHVRKKLDKLMTDTPSVSKISKTLRISRILKENKVDLGKITLTKGNSKGRYILLEEVKQQGVNIDKIIEENNLDGKFPLGANIIWLREVYKGMRSGKITEEERREAEELGILEKKSIISQTLEVAKILRENGVKYEKEKLFENYRYKVLKELEANGKDINEIIEKNGLDGDFPWGRRVDMLRRAYKNQISNKITEKERKEAEELGLVKSLKNKQEQKNDAIEKNTQSRELYKKYEELSIDINDITKEQ